MQQKLQELERVIGAEYENITGIAAWKDGEPVLERYFGGCSAENRLHVFSVTKSVVSILFGIALDKGLLDSIDRRVCDFFPDYTPKRGEKTLQSVTLRHMLTMTAPYKYKSNPYTKYFTSPDWVRFSLDVLGGKGRIGEFRYAPLIGPDILTGILTRLTGQSVLSFAQETLFAPLGISAGDSVCFQSREELMAFYQADTMRVWAAGPTGVNAGGWGLTLSPVDMAKIGQLFLNGGVWEGRRIVSERWVRESTREQSRWTEANLPYGYLWWVLEPEDGFAAIGDGGNILYGSRKDELTAAITSRFRPRVKDRLAFIRERIVPIFS